MLTLRPFQKAALTALRQPGHVLCIAPTGSGKSLIYERASSQPGRRTLLVTPLVALARQQHARLPDSSLTGRDGSVWITSPERLLTGGKQLARLKPDFLVVDEAHCLWEWGESFRPAFRRIPEILSDQKIQRSLWLTATLPPEARVELRAQVSPLLELGGFDLPDRLELHFARVPWVERAEALVGWVLQQREAGIVFTPTRAGTERLQRLLTAAGRASVAYHAGMSVEERVALESQVSTGQAQVVVATSAFGMGMNYPRLQWTALWQAPLSVLALAQAIGRVGRDPQKTSRALVLWDPEDFRLLEWSIRGSERRRARLIELHSVLDSRICRRKALKNYFDGAIAATEAGCGRCDVCYRDLIE